MNMSGEQRIAAPKQAVWAALNDPEILRLCIPGCQELRKTSETEMTATALIKVGPVTARFAGDVTLSDLDPPNGYRITGEGQGGVAGFAKGGAVVRLEDDGDATVLRYEVTAQVGGKLSQLGGRLIDSTAKMMSAAFFKRFAEELTVSNTAEAPDVQASHRSTASTSPRPATLTRDHPTPALDITPEFGRVWIAAAAVLGMALLLFVTYLAFARGGATADPGSPAGSQTPFLVLVLGVLFVVVGAVGYLFGRLANGASLPSR